MFKKTIRIEKKICLNIYNNLALKVGNAKP